MFRIFIIALALSLPSEQPMNHYYKINPMERYNFELPYSPHVVIRPHFFIDGKVVCLSALDHNGEEMAACYSR